MAQTEKGGSERLFVNILQKWDTQPGTERNGEGFCNFTLPVTLIWNLELTEALQVPQYGPLADHSI